MPSVTRLIQLSRGAPFYANSLEIHEHWGTMRRSDYFEIMAITGGEGWHTVSAIGRRGDTETLRPGQLFFFRPQDLHEFGAGPDGMTLSYVDFSLASWQHFAALAGVNESWFAGARMPRATFDPADRSAIQPFEAAVESIRRGATEFDLIRFWVEVIPTILAAHQEGSGTTAPPWLTQALDALREESNLRQGVPRLRELAHVSAAHLSRSIRSHRDRPGVGPSTTACGAPARHHPREHRDHRDAVRIRQPRLLQHALPLGLRDVAHRVPAACVRGGRPASAISESGRPRHQRE